MSKLFVRSFLHLLDVYLFVCPNRRTIRISFYYPSSAVIYKTELKITLTLTFKKLNLGIESANCKTNGTETIKPIWARRVVLHVSF